MQAEKAFLQKLFKSVCNGKLAVYDDLLPAPHTEPKRFYQRAVSARCNRAQIVPLVRKRRRRHLRRKGPIRRHRKSLCRPVRPLPEQNQHDVDNKCKWKHGDKGCRIPFRRAGKKPVQLFCHVYADSARRASISASCPRIWRRM